MHDYKQTTNATIGEGNINTGTTVNLDNNNNLISVSGGESYEGNINRNIQTAQVTTKHLSVEPIQIKETFEFGKNSTESQMKSSNAPSGERPTLWNDLSNQTTLQATGSILSDVGSGLLGNAKTTLTEFAFQVSLSRGFGNIVDGISTDVGSMTAEVTGNNSKGLEIKNQIDATANNVAGKVWASPNTVISLAYGGIGYLYGAATGQDVKFSIGNNAIQFIGNPIGENGAALTLGNSINYVGSARPDSGKSLANSGYYTYEYGFRNDGTLPADKDKIILGPHEGKHTYQAEVLGPLFLPVYFLSGGVNANNWIEKEADEKGNAAYINWKYNENK